MPPSPCAPDLLAIQGLPPILRIIGIGKISAADPFPAVAGHVENPVGACAFRKAIHRPEIVPLGAEVSADFVRRLAAPRKFAPIGATRRFFPFRLRRQALAQPPAISQGAVPRSL